MSRFLRLVGFAVLALLGRRRARRQADGGTAADHDPRRRTVPADRRAELLVAVFLLLAGVCGAAFIAVLITVEGRATQWLGLALALGLAALAAALIIAGKAVVPQEVAVEERETFDDPEGVSLLDEATAEGISRRRLIAGAAGVAAVGVGGALIAPAASLGPNVADRIDATPWRRGVRIVDSDGEPLHADAVVEGTFVTGYAEGAARRELGTPIVIVRLEPTAIELPAGRDPEEWTPEGLLAYSKICTHAACAISLYRYPTFPPEQPRPALVCPCHYSTFDPARGAEVIFGPAGRPLPQLPLAIDPATRTLQANGGFSGSVGPAWFGVDRGT